MTLWPRQVEILTAMCEGRDYPFPGATALERAKRKYAALNKLRALGYVEGSEITLKGRLALSAHLADATTPLAKLTALVGSGTRLAEVLGISPSNVTRMRDDVPEAYRKRALEWAAYHGCEAEVRDIFG